MVAEGQLRQWVDSPLLPDDYRLRTFVVVEARSSWVQQWWILMGGELTWEIRDIIEFASVPVMNPCNSILDVV